MRASVYALDTGVLCLHVKGLLSPRRNFYSHRRSQGQSCGRIPADIPTDKKVEGVLPHSCLWEC